MLVPGTYKLVLQVDKARCTTVQMKKWPQQGYTSGGKIHNSFVFRIEKTQHVMFFFYGLGHKMIGCFCLEVTTGLLVVTRLEKYAESATLAALSWLVK